MSIKNKKADKSLNAKSFISKEIIALSPMMKGSVTKVNDVCKLIRGMKCEEALNSLDFINRSPAYQIKKTLSSCVANARHNFKIKTDMIKILKIDVLSSLTLKRRICAGRGHSGLITKRYSKVRIHIGILSDGSDKIVNS